MAPCPSVYEGTHARWCYSPTVLLKVTLQDSNYTGLQILCIFCYGAPTYFKNSLSRRTILSYLWNLASHISVKPNLRSQTSLFLSINSLWTMISWFFYFLNSLDLIFIISVVLQKGKVGRPMRNVKCCPCTFILSEATLFKNISNLLMIKWPFLLESAFAATLRPGIHCCGFITVTELFLFFFSWNSDKALSLF